LESDSIIHAVKFVLTSKHTNYRLRCTAWGKRAYDRITAIQEELVTFISNIQGVSYEEWSAALDARTERVQRQNVKRFARWDRKAHVAEPPSTAVMEQAYRVACTDVAAIIRAMVVKIRQPAFLSFI
jgi:hypothetical protein